MFKLKIKEQENTVKLSSELGQFYTKEAISELLIDSMCVDPCTVVDLGCGDGSLTYAASRKWKQASFLTVDVNSNLALINDGKKAFHHTHVEVDALNFDLPMHLNNKNTAIDAGICNPPFIKVRWKDHFSSIMEEAGLTSAFQAIKQAPAEALFIAQNLRLLKNNGHLGLILPDGLICGEEFQDFRRTLLRQHDIQTVIKLPRRAFIGTDAQAYIVLLSKGRSTNSVLLKELDTNGRFKPEISISNNDGVTRLDYSYHQYHSKKALNSRATLSEIENSVQRGPYSSKDVKAGKLPVFHTTNFPTNALFYAPQWMDVTQSSNIPSKAVVAKAGDILLARVGRNFEEKVCMIKRGKIIISDCVYRLNVPVQYRLKLLEFLRSNEGKKALRAASRGVSATQLPKEQLLKLRLPNMRNSHEQ